MTELPQQSGPLLSEPDLTLSSDLEYHGYLPPTNIPHLYLAFFRQIFPVIKSVRKRFFPADPVPGS